MPCYLDPKNDLIFKRIFGEHPHLLKSFLNAVMPLPPKCQIESLEYLSPEQVPENPMRKDSIVDVKCRDNHGRQFIVEMQMYWGDLFRSRLVFNASKAYVRQLDRGESYHLLQTVYGLGIINDVFDHKSSEFYHHYQTINRGNTNDIIQGLEFVLVELPKFKPEKWSDRKMAVLWLRFLKEVDDETRNVSSDLLKNADIQEALDLCEESAFSPNELEIYDQHWDVIRTLKGLAESAEVAEIKGHAKGLFEGREEGREEGRVEGKAIGRKEGEAIGRKEGRAEGLSEGEAKGHAKGLAEGIEKMVLAAAQNNLSIEQIQAFSNLTQEHILEILRRNKLQ
ncbi:MAG: Rpn family recombination-promoting nuclease/putative transposase [Dysgonamonadaceae bacterium]|jgi:predicted transposase/invertase (TIGR01784 family)|nr:Rpn family recombination-promoting nuclease/putative transposase [Dysgonamonadaceae bacterium]